MTRLRKPANLKSLTKAIDNLDWFDARDFNYDEGMCSLHAWQTEKVMRD